MVKEMNVFVIILLGLALGVAGAVAIPLSHYISIIEDGSVCMQCEDRNDCFARKPLRKGKSNFVSEFMLFSYCIIRKNCTYCTYNKKNRYILYIFFNFILTMIPFWSKGFNLVGIIYGITAATLFSLSVVDWNTQYIPLELNGIIFICGLMQLFADFSNWLEYIIGLIAVSGFLYIINRISTPMLKKRYEGVQEIDSAIGDGDIKLMAATGLLLGWKLNFIALGIGCIAGSVIHSILIKVKKGDRQFALGPYLSLGVYITMICGRQLISWYLNMMGVKPL